ncbi:MAG: ATP-binding protein [Candidatus Dormibacteria bacterium]|jgi:signal transduction histidine kinase
MTRGSRWVIPIVALGVSFVTAPLVAAVAVALHATGWGELAVLGLAGAVLAVSLVVVPIQLRLAVLAGRQSGHWWRQAKLSAEREAELSAEREELLHDALVASDRERRQLAGDLHDGVIQLVSAVTLRTATLARGLRREGGQTPERIAAAVEGLDRITVDLQAVTADLRGLMGALAGDEIESGGLSGALSKLLVPLAESGISVDISIGELACDARVRSLIHRVVQELVRNVAKHAAAHRVELTLSQDHDEVRMALTDDGRGFDPGALGERQRRGHMGLLLVEQRVQDAGGVLQVTSTPGRGTKTVMRLPVTPAEGGAGNSAR